MDLQALKDCIGELDNAAVEKQLSQIRECLLPQGGDVGSVSAQTVYESLQVMLENEAGRKFIVKHRIVDILCQVVLQGSKGCDEACALLDTLFQHNGKACWQMCTDTLNAIISKYASLLSDSQLTSNEKMKHATFMEKLLSPANGLTDKPFDECTAKPEWGILLQAFVHDILQSKETGDEDKQIVLQMTGGALALLAHFELTETFLLKTLEDGSLDTSFFILLSNSACQQTCRLLNLANRQELNENAALLKSLYSIIACVLMAVLNSPKVQEKTDVTDIVVPPLAVAVHEVLSFVTYVASRPTEQFEESVVVESAILLSVGCLVDLASFQDRMFAVLPFLLGLGRDFFKRLKDFEDNESDAVDEKPTDVTGCLLVLLSFLVADNRCCQVIVDCEFYPCLLEYLRMLERTKDSRVDARREENADILANLIVKQSPNINHAIGMFASQGKKADLSSDDEKIQMASQLVLVSTQFAAHSSRTSSSVLQFLSFVIGYVPQMLASETVDNYLKDVFVLTGLTIMNTFTDMTVGSEEELRPFFRSVVQYYANSENKSDLCEGFLMEETVKYLEYTSEQASALTSLGWGRRLGVFSSVASQYPWLDTVILESGWMQSLMHQIQTSSEHEPQSSSDRITIDSSEAVMAQLCQLFPTVRQQVIDNGGVGLAEKLKLRELTKALTGQAAQPEEGAVSATTDAQSPGSSHMHAVVHGNVNSLVGAFLQFVEHMTRSGDQTEQSQESNTTSNGQSVEHAGLD